MSNDLSTDEYEDDRPRTWDDWPVCPACRQRRMAICPACETADNDVPLAEFMVLGETPRATKSESGADATGGQDSPDSASNILLMCQNCDESFAPRFYRHCENCGHDFGHGVELQQTDVEPVNHRVLLIVAGLGLLSLAAAIYFWLLAGN